MNTTEDLKNHVSKLRKQHDDIEKHIDYINNIVMIAENKEWQAALYNSLGFNAKRDKQTLAAKRARELAIVAIEKLQKFNYK